MSKSYRSDNSQERLLRLVFKRIVSQVPLSHCRNTYKLLSFELLSLKTYKATIMWNALFLHISEMILPKQFQESDITLGIQICDPNSG